MDRHKLRLWFPSRYALRRPLTSTLDTMKRFFAPVVALIRSFNIFTRSDTSYVSLEPLTLTPYAPPEPFPIVESTATISQSTPATIFKPESVVLRNEHAKGNSRHLSATYSSTGNLVIQGQDIGSEVESVFGYSEYEWSWTVQSSDLPNLLTALGIDSNLLVVLKQRFSGAAAGQLGEYLKTNDIPYEVWSRVGD